MNIKQLYDKCKNKQSSSFSEATIVFFIQLINFLGLINIADHKTENPVRLKIQFRES